MFWKMKPLPNDTMESLTERSLSDARERGIPVRFECNGKIFEAKPAPEWMGVIQEVGDIGSMPRYAEEARAQIMMCTRSIFWGWTIGVLFRECLTQSGYLLVAGQNSRYLRNIRIQLCERLSADNPAHLIDVTDRRITVRSGPIVFFETYMDPDSFRGLSFEEAFLQEEEQVEMAGNYNDFPWRSTNPERERFYVSEERKLKQEAKWAEYQSVLQAREESLKAKAEEERKAEQPRFAMLKPRSAGITASSVAMMQEQARQYFIQKWENDALNAGFGRPVFSVMESTSSGNYAGISRSQPPSAEQRLAVVRDVLLRHLRFQLSQAPGPSAVYSNYDGVITAADISRVVNALEERLPGEQFFQTPYGLGIDFAAESQDGSKIVVENKFQTGVIFDPQNKPIRKFRLHEEVA